MSETGGAPSKVEDAIQSALEGKLLNGHLDVVDIVPIPRHGDRMVRLRTLEEALEDFDHDQGETISYLVQLKPSSTPKAPEPAPAALAPSAKPSLDGIYLPDGKLNIAFLAKNANLLFEAGEFTLARNIYKTILQSGERSSLALFGLARCCDAEGKLEEARAHYEESIAYHGTLESYRSLAALFMRQEKDGQAAATLLRALHLKELGQKDRFELHQACGNCFARAKNLKEAETHYEKALELNPTADEIRANLGALYLQNQKFSEAKHQFQNAIAINPRNAKALFGLGSCSLAAGEKREAHDYFVKSLNIELNNPSAIFHLVKCAYEIKSYASAARLVEEYIEIAPVNINLLYSLAGLQFHLARTDEAGATVRRILVIAPTHAGAKELLGMIDRHGSSIDPK
ncbi:MAG TPA: tetratricopeptide repeat protein [Bdellovibrionota bacterium]|nr:tetratricopeptide repeat protein [Bdellovibrionota bacterium]